MRTADAIRYFGNKSRLARALGIRQPSVQEWGEIVPPLRQLQIERLTGAALKASEEVANPGTHATAQ